MGTTTSVLVLLPQGAIVAHVGDSRVYRFRQGRLEQLTFDHSLVWEMTATGQLPAGDVANFIPKNIITRSLGPHAEVKVDLEGPLPLQTGDTFVLCSDGLSGQVKDEQIAAILGAMSPSEAARALIDLANLHGGPDNVTVIVVRVAQPPPKAPDEQAFHVRPIPARSSSLPALAVWVVLGVALLTAAGLALIGHKIGAAVSLGWPSPFRSARGCGRWPRPPRNGPRLCPAPSAPPPIAATTARRRPIPWSSSISFSLSFAKRRANSIG
jgi:protein phosphatase